jgi:hypothetical protein
MRRLFAGIALTMLVAAARAAPDAFEAECAAEASHTVVELRFDPGGVSIEQGRMVAELTAHKSRGGGWKTSGLTTSRQRFGIRTQTRVLLDDAGRACALPRFELTVTLLAQQVWIGREFAPGSCSFDQIMAHEMRHVDANRVHARQVAEAFQGRLREAFAHAPVLGDPTILEARIVHILEAHWMPQLKAALEADDPHQSAIDTEAEFERLSNACGRAVPATLDAQAAH